MTAVASMDISLLSFWHCGTGRGRSAVLDGIVARDPAGFPYLPGRSLRGLLRDGVRQLEELGCLPANSELFLFGDPGFETETVAGNPVPRRGTRPGRLVVTDARVNRDLVSHMAALPGHERAGLLSMLFRTLTMTAVNEHGVVKHGSLRAIEVAVPLGLTARIELIDRPVLPHAPFENEAEMEAAWADTVGQAAGLVKAVGAYRSRGFGRCCMVLGEADQA